MTNEEAKRRMEICRDFLVNNYSDIGEPNFMAFNMAIKALEQQSCEDCISRESVMKCFKKWQPYMATRLWDYEQELIKLPSVIPSYNSIKTELKPCEDCISREETLRHTHIEYDDDGVGHKVVYAEDIEELPSVTPQQKIGHWIDIETLDSALWHECSECGETEFYATNYCPNCGAKMEVEE